MSSEERREEKSDRRKYIGYLVGGLVVGGVIGAAGGYLGAPAKEVAMEVPKEVTKTVTKEVTTTVTAPTTPAVERFDGKKLVVLTVEGPYVYNINDWKMGGWEELTGGKVELVAVPFAEITTKFMTAAMAGVHSYDIVMMTPPMMPEPAEKGYLTMLDDQVKEPAWDANDALPIARQNAQWGGHYYAVPCDADTILYVWRKDAMSNEDYRNEFKTKYGYEMPSPDLGPSTWNQAIDLAEFFHGWDFDNDGIDEWGWCTMMGRGIMMYMFWDHAAHFKIPGVPWYHFDPDTMNPLVNTPGYVRALEDFVKLIEFSNPGAINNYAEIRDMVLEGRFFSTEDFTDYGQLVANPHIFVNYVDGIAGLNSVPGAEEVWDFRENKWIKVETIDPGDLQKKPINFAPTVSHGGWLYTVPETTPDKDMAWSYIRYITGKENSFEESIDTAHKTGMQLWRESSYVGKEWWWDAMGYDPMYMKVTIEILRHENTTFMMRMPGGMQYLDALDEEIHNALGGTKTPQEAFDDCYDRWEDITNRLGRDTVKRYYYAMMGIPLP